MNHATPGSTMPPARPAVNPWLIALIVVVPTFMEVLDSTITIVALRYIAGGLSASAIDSEWAFTSYLTANAIILPISGWLAAYLGRRNYFLISIAGFTIASMMCGMATSLGELVLFRVIQGLAGGGLQPCTQGVLLDAFPKEKQGAAQTLFAVAGVIAPILGPTLGGWFTDYYSWRWIFYVNVPVGLLSFVGGYALLEDPDYLKALRAKRRVQPLPFDMMGLVSLVTAVVCGEVLLSKGEEWGWLSDPFRRVHALVGLAVAATTVLIIWEPRHPNPLIDFRPLARRNFLASCVIIFCALIVRAGTTTSLPGMLQSLFGYDALNTGLVMSPASFFSLAMMPVVATLLGRGFDARWLIFLGLTVSSAGYYWMSQMNLFISPGQVVWPRVVSTIGVAMIYAPLSVVAFSEMPNELRGAAVGIFSLLRNEGGSVGASLAKTVKEQREQFHTLRLGEHVDLSRPSVHAYTDQVRLHFLQQNGDSVLSQNMAWRVLSNLRERHALALAYFDTFWIFAVLGVLLIPLLLMMKRPATHEDGHLDLE